MYVLKQDLTQFLSYDFKDRPLTQQDFINSIGYRLELVPVVITERAMIEIYQNITSANMNKV